MVRKSMYVYTSFKTSPLVWDVFYQSGIRVLAVKGTCESWRIIGIKERDVVDENERYY